MSRILKRHTISILSLYVLFFLSSCQPTVTPQQNQTKLFADFYLRLVQNEPLVKGEVSFFEGDSLASAIPRTFKQVLINNQLMAAKELKMKGTSYRGSLSASADSLYTFSFINGNDQQQSHQITVDRIEAFLIKEPWKRSTGMTIVWKGSPLGEQDQMVVLFTDENNKSTFIEVKGPTRWSEVTLTSSQTKNLPLGEGKMYLVRKSNQFTESENHVFTSRVEFFTAPLIIHVTE